jgi:hypothetical protein
MLKEKPGPLSDHLRSPDGPGAINVFSARHHQLLGLGGGWMTHCRTWVRTQRENNGNQNK